MRLFTTVPESLLPEGEYEIQLQSRVSPEHIAPRLDGFSDGWAAARAADADAVVRGDGFLRIDAKTAVPVLAQRLYEQSVRDRETSGDWLAEALRREGMGLRLPTWDQLHPTRVGMYERLASEILYGLPMAP